MVLDKRKKIRKTNKAFRIILFALQGFSCYHLPLRALVPERAQGLEQVPVQALQQLPVLVRQAFWQVPSFSALVFSQPLFS